MILESERVLIIGGTSGMGWATARAAAAEGAQVIVASSRRDSVDNALRRLPSGSAGFVADMNDPGAAQRLITEVGDLDHLVYTAGERGELMMPLSDYDDAKARGLLGVRFFGALAAVAAVAGVTVRPRTR